MRERTVGEKRDDDGVDRGGRGGRDEMMGRREIRGVDSDDGEDRDGEQD